MVDQPCGLGGESQLTLSLVLVPIIDGRGKSELIGELGAFLLMCPMTIPLIEGRTVQECIAIGLNRAGHEGTSKASLEMYNLQLNMLLYLCSDDPEIEGVVPGQVKRAKNEMGVSPHDVQAWDVGMRIGSQLRKGEDHMAGEASEGGVNGSKMRPHLRGAHWHGYWYGPRAASERAYKVRWVAPTMVNAESSDSLVTTIRPVSAKAT
jgi:hypothetical protein